jgi:hypothetical protein
MARGNKHTPEQIVSLDRRQIVSCRLTDKMGQERIGSA